MLHFRFQPTWVGSTTRRPVMACCFFMPTRAVTFDLDAVRRANPNYKLLRFRAVAGDTGDGSADLWVIVDGQSRFGPGDQPLQRAMPVNVAVGQRDRFLTLAATDGGDGIGQDWTMFGDPRLELLTNGDILPNCASAAGQKTLPDDNGREEVHLESEK